MKKISKKNIFLIAINFMVFDNSYDSFPITFKNIWIAIVCKQFIIISLNTNGFFLLKQWILI